MKHFTKKLALLTLLAGMCGSAWADGSKRVLNSQNYETATASDWTSPNGTVSLKTGDATYGNYAQVDVSGNGNRSCYKTVDYDYEPDGYTSAEMITKGYVIEFDLRMAGGRQKDRSEAQFVVPTTGPNLGSNSAYSGTDYIFALSQPLNTTGALETTWYVNDLTNSNNSITLNDAWYHFKLTVTKTSVDYTITSGTETIKAGSLTVSELPKIKGFFGLVGRTYGRLAFDNLDIYDYTANVTVSVPTFTFKKVTGSDRVYTIANPNESGTLYYTTDAADEAPEIGSDAYTSTTELSIDATFTESGTYYAYVLHNNGTTTSPVVSQAITTGEVTLASPVFTVTDMVLAEDGFYYPQISFSIDNSAIEGAPVATFDQTSPYTFTGKGSFTVTASAEGYTSSSATYTVNDSYLLKNTIDFGALTADDFDTNVWETATGAPRDYWTNRAAAIPADVTYYKLIDSSADCSAVLDGITITNGAQRQPEVYIGYGLLTPYASVSGSSNNMNFTVNDTQTTDFVVYNGWNNYGSGTFNTVLNGTATFGLYRYDTMLRTIKVYSPGVTVPGTLEAGKYATRIFPFTPTVPEGIIFYSCGTIEDGRNLALREVEAPRENIPYILYNNKEDAIDITQSGVDIHAADEYESEWLIGVFADKVITSGYVLQTQNGKQAFYKVDAENPITVPPYRAYLNYTAGVKSIGFDTTTAINTLEVLTSGAYEGIYTVDGVKLNRLEKGVNILKMADGTTRKVVVK